MAMINRCWPRGGCPRARRRAAGDDPLWADPMLSLTNRAAFGCLIPVASGKVKAAAASQKLPPLPTDLLPELQKLRARDAPAPAQLWEGEGEAGAQLLARGDQALLVGGDCPPCPESWP